MKSNPGWNGLAFSVVMAVAFAAAKIWAQTNDAAAALREAEARYDSTPTDDATRAALRQQFAELRRKVPANADPKQAGAWKVKAFAFRELDFAWTDKRGTNHHAQYRYRDDEVDRLRRGMAGFADRVWQYTDGHLRIDWELQVIDKTLTRLDGGNSFWPGPDACMKHLPEFKAGETDTIMVFVKTSGDKRRGEASGRIPLMLFGGAFGSLGALTRDATYIGFNWGSGAADNEPDGEPMLHEWLHSAQWALEDYQGYPRGLMCTSDGGRMEGEQGGDPCYRRKPEEPSWMRFYEHLMREHVTRRMWRELSITRPPDNVWANTFCREFVGLGPFRIDSKPNWGLDEPFVSETAVSLTGMALPAGTAWRPLRGNGRVVDLAEVFGARNYRVSYLAVNVRSEREQAAQMRVGSDDGCKVWHNGKPVLTAAEPRGVTPDQDQVPVTLQRGDNLFLLKVANVGGGWAACFRVTDPQGAPLPSIRYLAPRVSL